MPSQTFLNLPEEKKKRLLRAAQKEFARVPFESASINKIIQSAEISRGSFYMYFSSKGELFFYLLTDTFEMLKKKILLSLEKSDGNLFDLCKDLFDAVCTALTNPETLSFARNGFDYLHSAQMGAKAGNERGHHREELRNFLRLLGQKVNLQGLDVKNQAELDEMLFVLLQTLQRYTAQILFQNVTPETAKIRMLRTLHWMQYGMLEPDVKEKTTKEDFCVTTS